MTVGALGNIPAKWQPLLAHLPVVYPGYDDSPASWVSVSSFVKWGLHQLIQRALFNFTVLVPGWWVSGPTGSGASRPQPVEIEVLRAPQTTPSM